MGKKMEMGYFSSFILFKHLCHVNITLVAATEAELSLLKKALPECPHTLHFLTHGVGTVNTTYHLTQYALQHKPDLLIQCGIAGSFREVIVLGEVVEVVADCFADIGAEEADGNFLPWMEIGLQESNATPYTHGWLQNPIPPVKAIRQVKAITVNTCSGSIPTINFRRKKFDADIETMEGAAFLFVALQQGIPCRQIRGISNAIEPRNKDHWQIALAIENYTKHIVSLLQSL